MKTQIIDGKKIADKILIKIKKEVEALKKKSIRTKLAVVLVGNNKASLSYIKKKQESAELVGIDFELVQLPDYSSKKALISRVKEIQNDPKLSGLIVQLPLPEPLYTPEVLNSIDPKFDVDCLTHENFGRMVMKSNIIAPPTAGAVISVLDELKVKLNGKNVTIVGTGALVGKPLALMMMNKEATVTTCNIYSNVKKKCLDADIIVSAVGKINLITKDMIKKGAIILDTGISFANHKMHGDVDVNGIYGKASYVTPTPGGIGPITVAMLLHNTVTLAKQYKKL